MGLAAFAPQASAAKRPHITRASVSARTLGPGGGTVVLSVSLKYATRCTLSVAPGGSTSYRCGRKKTETGRINLLSLIHI